MDTIRRLNELIEAKCGERGATAFSKLIGIHQVTLNNYILGKRKLSLEVIEAVLNTFPDVSAEWLLRGCDVTNSVTNLVTKDVANSADTNDVTTIGVTKHVTKDVTKNVTDNSAKTLPRIPHDAAAGSLTDSVDGVTEFQCERLPVVAAFPKYDFTIRVTGRSMEPMYYSGDEVACLRINEVRFIQWGRVHVLDTTQGVVIKRIYENGENIRCVSFNPEFPDFNVPKEDIRSFNLVVGALRL